MIVRVIRNVIHYTRTFLFWTDAVTKLWLRLRALSAVAGCRVIFLLKGLTIGELGAFGWKVVQGRVNF